MGISILDVWFIYSYIDIEEKCVFFFNWIFSCMYVCIYIDIYHDIIHIDIHIYTHDYIHYSYIHIGICILRYCIYTYICTGTKSLNALWTVFGMAIHLPPSPLALSTSGRTPLSARWCLTEKPDVLCHRRRDKEHGENGECSDFGRFWRGIEWWKIQKILNKTEGKSKVSQGKCILFEKLDRTVYENPHVSDFILKEIRDA